MNRKQRAFVEGLSQLCHEKGATLQDKGNGHFQIRGRLLVNYYPFSKLGSAYVAGTAKAATQVTPSKAVTMAFEAPQLPEKTKRRRSYKAQRERLLKKHPHCHWCNAKLSAETATLEHIIPLSRGGLDNANNWALACEPCNQSRDSDMPELEKAR